MRVVFFDAAGTLFHVRGSVGRIYSDVARSLGVEADAEELHRSFAGAFRARSARGFPETRARDQRHAEREWWMSVVREAFGDRMPEQTLPACFARLFELFRGSSAWELFPDSLPVLQDLQARAYRLGVISNFDSRLHDVLASLGIDGCFERVFLSWQIGIAKPEAGIFLHALEAMKVLPSQAVYIGDSPEEDAAGALAAGMRAILLDRAGSRGAPSGVESVRSLTEVCSLLPG